MRRNLVLTDDRKDLVNVIITFIKTYERCRVAYDLKNKENKGDVELTLSQKQQQ